MLLLLFVCVMCDCGVVRMFVDLTHFPFLLSEQGLLQNRKQSEAKKAMGEQEAEGNPDSHRCTCGERHRHRGYGSSVKLQWEQK